MSRFFRVLAALVCCLSFAAFGALNVPPPVFAEAEGPDGAIVGFTVTVVGGNDGSDGRPADTVTCSPASLFRFPLGTTTVSCSGSEGSTGSFTVTVSDTTAPRLSLPRDFTVVTTSPSGQAVTYVASATDLVDGSVSISCSPASGSVFPLGTTSVSCSASDSRGNSATGSFNITVATTPPPPGNPDLTAEATGPDGARVTFNTGDPDDGDGRPGTGECSPAPGSLFPLGNTTVVCPSGNFIVSVVDTTAPALHLPSGVTAVATGPSGAAVTYSATSSDLVDGSVSVVCTPSSGSTFALGITQVNCSASDTRGNTATGSFPVQVTAEPQPPVDPDDITEEATGSGGAVVSFNLGNDSGGRPITCVPPSGSLFPLGVTNVACSEGITFKVTVVDTTPPVLTLPANMTREATSPAGATATFSATANDLVDGAVTVVCTPPSGSTFAMGTITVSCSASDSRGNASSGSFTVKVVDTTAPAILSVSVSPSSIWPPNKKLVDVTVTANVSDIADPAPLVRIYAITCDETIAAGDAVITGAFTAKLRADRDAQGNGRVYTLHLEAIDASGNRSIATVIVTVPRDQSAAVVPAPPRRRAVGSR